MKQYIVYNTVTYKIIKQFDYFSSEISNLIRETNIDYINTIYPKSSKIKEAIINKIKYENNLVD